MLITTKQDGALTMRCHIRLRARRHPDFLKASRTKVVMDVLHELEAEMPSVHWTHAYCNSIIKEIWK